MKTLKKISLLSIVVLSMLSCKKRNPSVSEIYKPRLIASYGGSELDIYDMQNVNAPKMQVYTWNTTTHIFEFYKTIDTSTEYYYLKNFPKISDPIITGLASLHIQDRSVDDKTFFFNFSLPNSSSKLTIDHPGIPNRWTKAKKIDAYFLFTEKYNEPTGRSSYFYFDFEAGEYLFGRNDAYIDNFKITDLIKKPNGNMTTDPIDWSLGDAGFSYEDDRYPNEISFVVLDYDAKKYVLFTRKTGNVGDAGRQTLRTTSWQPMSALFDVWKI